MSRRLKSGDYVAASKYKDGDVRDHFCVGFYLQSYDHFGQTRFLVNDSDGKLFRRNGFRRVQKISKERGEWLVQNIDMIEKGSFSFWYWVRKSKREVGG